MKHTIIDTAKVEGNIIESPFTKYLDISYDNNEELEEEDEEVKETASPFTSEKKEKESFLFPDGGWECSRCLNYNFKGRKECNRCKKIRSSVDP